MTAPKKDFKSNNLVLEMINGTNLNIDKAEYQEQPNKEQTKTQGTKDESLEQMIESKEREKQELRKSLKTKRVQLLISPNNFSKAKANADALGISFNQYITLLIEKEK